MTTSRNSAQAVVLGALLLCGCSTPPPRHQDRWLTIGINGMSFPNIDIESGEELGARVRLKTDTVTREVNIAFMGADGDRDVYHLTVEDHGKTGTSETVCDCRFYYSGDDMIAYSSELLDLAIVKDAFKRPDGIQSPEEKGVHGSFEMGTLSAGVLWTSESVEPPR